MTRRVSRGRRIRFAVLAAAIVIGACQSDEPGLDPGVGTDREAPSSTSNTLGRCPPGGPDATTPPAGCLGPDGSVQRP